MTRTITLALAIFAGFVCLASGYSNTSVAYAPDLECANCIRSGNNYCIWIGGQGNQTVLSWNCTETYLTNGTATGPGGVPESFYCSNGVDQMNAIVGACRPWINQNHNDDCGPYLVDLSDSNSFTLGRSIQKLPLNASCTYRAVSKCGYPEVYFRVHNQTLQNDFDVAWATNEGMGPTDDIEGFDRQWTPAWNGSKHSDANTEFYQLGQASRTDVEVKTIDSDQWNLCTSTYKNLWVTITRTKDSSMATKETAPRSLNSVGGPYQPGGVMYPDFDVSFSNK